MERSASSITSLLEPRTTMLTVFPGLVQPVIWSKETTTTDISVIGRKGGREGGRKEGRDVSQPIEIRTDLDQLAGALQVDLLCQLSGAQHLRREVVNVGDGFGADGLKRRMTVLGDFRGTES